VSAKINHADKITKISTSKMNIFNNNPPENCRWNVVSLGEVLLRFDPVEARIHDARGFRVFDGGAEYRVACNLAKTFNLREFPDSLLRGFLIHPERV
jgi:hypothetical protein